MTTAGAQSADKKWVHVGPRDLLRSFDQHAAESDRVSGTTAHLLLFYAVECGLKGIALRLRKGRSTKDYPAEVRAAGHDLREVAKHLRLPPQLRTHLAYPECARRAASEPKVAPKQWHEAWRYGAILDAADETAAVHTLTELRQWCKENAR